MNIPLPLLTIGCLFLSSCDKPGKTYNGPLQPDMALPEPWHHLKHPYDKYPSMQHNRPIIVAFGAHWTETTQMAWRGLFSDKVNDLLKRNGWLCFVADLTHNDEFLSAELERIERTALPTVIVFDPKAEE